MENTKTRVSTIKKIAISAVIGATVILGSLNFPQIASYAYPQVPTTVEKSESILMTNNAHGNKLYFGSSSTNIFENNGAFVGHLAEWRTNEMLKAYDEILPLAENNLKQMSEFNQVNVNGETVDISKSEINEKQRYVGGNKKTITFGAYLYKTGVTSDNKQYYVVYNARTTISQKAVKGEKMNIELTHKVIVDEEEIERYFEHFESIDIGLNYIN